MLKHRCSALMTFMLLKHHWSTLLTFFLRPKNHPVHFPLFLLPKHYCQTCFVFPSITETPLQHTFLSPTTPDNLSFPHHPSLLKQLRPAIVSPFSNAETPLFSTFSSLPRTLLVHHFLTLHHLRNNSVQQLFRLFSLLKHHCQQPFIFFSITMLKHHCSARLTFFHDAETPLFSMFDFFPMLKHYRSALFDFLPILKHQSSAVLHLQQLFRPSLLLKHQSFTIVRQQAFTPSDYSSTF
jgi:hypothetical protein